jgi:hypothetical protein
VTYEEKAKLFEELRELSKLLKVPVIVAKQHPHPNFGSPLEWRQRPDLIVIDYPDHLTRGS